MWGALFSGIGCFVLILVNIIFVPAYGYMACAWGGVAGYGLAMILSYVIGQKKYPIDYPVKTLSGYILLTVLFYSIMVLIKFTGFITQISINSALIIIFLFIIAKCERLNFKKTLKRKK